MRFAVVTKSGRVENLASTDYFDALEELLKDRNQHQYYSDPQMKLLCDGDIVQSDNLLHVAEKYVMAKNRAIIFATELVKQEHKPAWM